MKDDKRNLRSIDTLRGIMARLRDPEDGCPWDSAQTFETISPYTLEEAYEVADAVARGDTEDLRDELGDLLLQVVFHAEIAKESGRFTFDDVVEAICAKMMRRHPHIFAGAKGDTARAVKSRWEAVKEEERREKNGGEAGVLDDVPLSLPALSRAVKLQKRAARVGFDWPETASVLEKIGEETVELSEEIAAGRDVERISEEFGDLLFVYANLARHLDVDPEAALRSANDKFVRRFKHIETCLDARGKRPEDATLEEMDALWNEAKGQEKD